MRIGFVLALTAGALSATPAQASEYQCIALDMAQADFTELANIMLEGTQDAPDGFAASDEKCTAQHGWSEDEAVRAREFAIYAAGFDGAMARLASLGVSEDQVDALMRSLPRDVAQRMRAEDEEFTEADAEVLLERMDAAGIDYSEQALQLLTIVAIAALGMQQAEG